MKGRLFVLINPLYLFCSIFIAIIYVKLPIACSMTMLGVDFGIPQNILYAFLQSVVIRYCSVFGANYQMFASCWKDGVISFLNSAVEISILFVFLIAVNRMHRKVIFLWTY